MHKIRLPSPFSRNVQIVMLFFSYQALKSCPSSAATQFLEHVVPAVLLEHEVALAFWLRRAEVVPLDFRPRFAEFPKRFVNVVLVDHDAGFRAASFCAELGAQAVEVEFAVLEVGVGLKLSPVQLLVL